MKIKLLRKADIPACVAIVRQNYSKRYARLATRELGAMFSECSNNPTYLVAEDHGTILGFAGYIQSWMDYNIYEIFWVNVTPDRQQNGIGKKLVGRIIRNIKQKKHAHLIVLTANRMRGLPKYYARHFGFRTIRRFGTGYNLMAIPL